MVVGQEEAGHNKSGFYQRIRRLFGSMRLAVILMLVITALSMVGALLIQVPANIAEDPSLYSQWVDTVAGNKVGSLAQLLSELSLFDVFHSPWFIIAGTLLILNIFMCSINRWSGISASLRGGAVRHKDAFYAVTDSCIALATGNLQAKEGADIAERVMKSRGFHVRSTGDETAVYLAGDKNRFFRLGTYASHVSLVLFVLAFVAGNYFGFQDYGFTIPEGNNRAVGHDTGLSLQLVSFVDEYYDSGRPKDYRSQVILYENGEAVKQTIIRVNHPLIYNGIRFYQSYYGPAVSLRVKDGAGNKLFNGGVALEQSLFAQDYLHHEGFFDLPGTGLTVRVIKAGSSVGSPMIPAGLVAVDIRTGSDQIDLKLLETGVPRVVSGLEFTYLEVSRYSGFQVRHDPTNGLIWVASTLFLLGICAVLYFPYRQVWIQSETRGNGEGRLVIRMSGSRGNTDVSELPTLAAKIEKELSEQNN
ncbi:cytochrome c biogenesis protein ResB [Chloroflexota bacterium]